MKLSAAIFDLNGTVISDEDEWGEAFRKILKTLGVDEKAEYPHVGGIGVKENWRIFIEKYHIKTDKSADELATLTTKEYSKLIPQITLKEGFENLAVDFKDSGVKIALATSSTWGAIEKVLEELGLEDYFDCITTGEEVSFKKPSPQIFDVTAEKLSVDPEECLVFEDSKAGIEAAIDAGMKTVGIYRDDEHKRELAEADLLIKNFGEVSPAKISEIE